jgi:polyphosphate kinase
VVQLPPDGMSPGQQLAALRELLVPQLEQARLLWRQELIAGLKAEGIRVLSYDELKSKQRRLMRRHFEKEIFPALTPLAFDPAHPFPHISNLSINLAVVLNEPGHGERFARLKVPHMLPRLLRIPSEERAGLSENLGLEEPETPYFVWLEEVVAANVDLLFPGLEIVSTHPFRVTRDADIEIREDEASDLLEAMQEVVGMRYFGSAVRLEVDQRMPQRIRDIISENLQLAPYQIYAVDSPLGLSDLMQLTKLDRPKLKDPPFLPVEPPPFKGEDSFFSVIKRRDVLLYHPYDSFGPVIDFVRRAARDPDVLAIKQTLYRVGPDSPIVRALMQARQNGKQVAVMVELKARFDEENNIVWAQALEHAGVHVVYGVLGLKIHAKLCLVVRREAKGIARYLHLGTGNYNPITARIYTDLGLFTADQELAEDVSNLFNALTGYSRQENYRKLLVAPATMRAEILHRIEREVRRHRKHGDGHIVFKCNALVDKACIRALYQASQAGVRIELQVRGICCLRPGVPKVSETITVTSVVGRFLEHSRIFYFRNGGKEEMLVGSADIMPRNLDGRVEVFFPVEDPRLRAALRDQILFLHLRDTAQSRRLLEDGTYRRVEPGEGEAALDSQRELLQRSGTWHAED